MTATIRPLLEKLPNPMANLALLYGSAFLLAGVAPGFYVLALANAVASVGFGMFHPTSFALKIPKYVVAIATSFIDSELLTERATRRRGSYP